MTHRFDFKLNLHFATAIAVAAALLGAAADVYAQDASSGAQPAHVMGQHPAVLVQRQPMAIDSNRFIVAHPARLAVIDTPTPTYAHPAVAVARMTRMADSSSAELDRQLAQPPMASAWLRHGPLTPSPTASSTTTASGG